MVKERDKIRYKKIAEVVDELGCKSVGDFASGDQSVKKFLKKDISYRNYDYPEYDFNEEFRIKENLDCVIFSEVFEHLRNPRNFLHSLSESMERGAKIIITTPNSSFLKSRVQLLFGKTPESVFGPSYLETLFSKNYNSLSKKEKLSLDFNLHVRVYNYKEIKKILELERFKIIKRIKLKHPGIIGSFLYLLPLNFQGNHFIIAELNKEIQGL